MQMIFILPELWWWWNLLGYHIGFPMQEQELFANIWMQFVLEVINKSKMNCSWRKESWSNKEDMDQINFHKKRNTNIGPGGKICSSNRKVMPLEIFPSGLCRKTQLSQGNFFIWNCRRKHWDNFVGWPLKGKVFINLKVKVCKFIGRKIDNRGFLLTKVRSLDIFFLH